MKCHCSICIKTIVSPQCCHPMAKLMNDSAHQDGNKEIGQLTDRQIHAWHLVTSPWKWRKCSHLAAISHCFPSFICFTPTDPVLLSQSQVTLQASDLSRPITHYPGAHRPITALHFTSIMTMLPRSVRDTALKNDTIPQME